MHPCDSARCSGGHTQKSSSIPSTRVSVTQTGSGNLPAISKAACKMRCSTRTGLCGSASRRTELLSITQVPSYNQQSIYSSFGQVSERIRTYGSQTSCRGTPLHCKAVETDAEEQVQIEGIDRAYCDEFVCTSSPQVEQNVKALARDTTRLSTWTTSLFRKDVQYKDAFLSFRGADKYKRLKFVKDVVGYPKVLVTKIRMLDKGKALVEWRLRGQVAVFPVDIDFGSEFGLDLITGRVYSHTESWDLSRMSPLATFAYTLSRAVWSLGLRGSSAKDDLSSFFKRFQNEDERDSLGGNISADPMDPTKFFQDSDPSQDLFSIGLIIAFVWLIYQAYAEIAKL